ncbi:MAG: hypothetical protein ABI903_08600 [Actinomycetota bacterium]
MAMIIHWPIPYDHRPNDFEVVGRHIAQTILMERFIDLILLNQGWKPQNLKRTKLATKIDGIQDLIEQDAARRDTWADLPGRMREVARNSHAFAHRMFERDAIPMHYAQGLEYDPLTDNEPNDQNRRSFIASELCRQLAGWFLDPPLNSGYQHRRSSPPGSRSGPSCTPTNPADTRLLVVCLRNNLVAFGHASDDCTGVAGD